MVHFEIENDKQNLSMVSSLRSKLKAKERNKFKINNEAELL